MYNLKLEKQVRAINLLLEGVGLRATARLTPCSVNTLTRLLESVGYACQCFHNDTVKQLNCNRLECDEIWSFVYAKQKNIPRIDKVMIGNAWVWVAIDPETKLIVSWHVAQRDTESACTFMQDVAKRLSKKVQISSDGLPAYEEAVEYAFEGNVHFAQLVKKYGYPTRPDGTKSRRKEYIGADKTVINGNPDKKYITTSHVERQNLTMRMNMSRFNRKTNKHSKKWENHCYAIAMHFVYYNFVRFHSTIRVTPAMEAGLTKRWMEIEDMIMLTKKYPLPK